MPKYEELLQQVSANWAKTKPNAQTYPIDKANQANLLQRTIAAPVFSYNMLDEFYKQVLDDKLTAEEEKSLANGIPIYRKRKNRAEDSMERTYCIAPDPDPAVGHHLFFEVKKKDATGAKAQAEEINLEKGATKTRKIAWDMSGPKPVAYASLTFFIAADDEKGYKKFIKEKQILAELAGEPGFAKGIPVEREVRDEKGLLLGRKITIYSEYMPANLLDVMEGKWDDKGLDKTKVAFGDIQVEAYKLDIMQQLLAAVATLHARGIEHGDLKPQNILVDFKNVAPEGQSPVLKPIVKIIDFDYSDRFAQAKEVSLTGSAPFMSPPKLIRAISSNILIDDFYDTIALSALRSAYRAMGLDMTKPTLDTEEARDVRKKAFNLFIKRYLAANESIEPSDAISVKARTDELAKISKDVDALSSDDYAKGTEEIIAQLILVYKNNEALSSSIREALQGKIAEFTEDRICIKRDELLIAKHKLDFNHPVDGANDMWALGIVFYSMLASNMRDASKHTDVTLLREMLNFDPTTAGSVFKIDAAMRLFEKERGGPSQAFAHKEVAGKSIETRINALKAAALRGEVGYSGSGKDRQIVYKNPIVKDAIAKAPKPPTSPRRKTSPLSKGPGGGRGRGNSQ